MKDEIFTVGDKTQFGTIKSFYICQDKDNVDYGCMMVCFEEVRANRNLMEVQKAKQKLFTTEDGKDIYEGDRVWFVSECFYLDQYDFVDTGNRSEDLKHFPYYKYFSIEAAAKDYIVLNKPCLSYSDIIKLAKIWYIGEGESNNRYGHIQTNDLKKLVEEKINNGERQ